MFRGFALSLLIAVVYLGSSCNVVEEPIEFSPDAFSLDGTKWVMKDCPHDPFLIINGYADCEYLSTLEFRDGKVYITYGPNDLEVPHHICFMDGSHLTVSIQDCSNTTWRPMFEWDVLAMDNNAMSVNVEVPFIMSDYLVQFDYERVN